MTGADEPEPVSVMVDVGAWVRVSTAGQDEANQVPDIERYCAAHGYRIAKWYQLNDKSASKGEQQKHQDEAVDDIRDGTIKVVICWNSDRVERRGPEALFKWLREIKDAGGRLESTSEPLLGTEDLSGEATTALSAVINHQESVKRSERQRISIEAAKSRGALYSIIPWAMETEGEKGHKHIVPTDLCREVVPKIFDRCIDGQSFADIARWLDSEGIPTPRDTEHWSESTVRWIIKQRAYAGRWLNRDGELIQEVEQVVKPSTFGRAQQALKNRRKRGSTSKTPTLLIPKCLRCGAPMYRVRSGNPGNKRRYYYRCYGKMPQRKGCGNMVPLETTDIIITAQIFTVSTEPHRTRQWVEGINWDDDISRVKQLMREAVETERFGEMAELQAELAEYRRKNEQGGTTGHYESEEVHNKDGSVRTVGQHFGRMTTEEKRQYLKTRDIRVEKVGKDGIRVMVDGKDLGIHVYRPLAA